MAANFEMYDNKTHRSSTNDLADDERESEMNVEDGWHMVTAEDGSTYYWNSISGETSWDAPYGESVLSSINNLVIEGEEEINLALGESEDNVPHIKAEVLKMQLNIGHLIFKLGIQTVSSCYSFFTS